MAEAEENTRCATFSALSVACTRAWRSLSRLFIVESISSALDLRLSRNKKEEEVEVRRGKGGRDQDRKVYEERGAS